MSTASQLGAFLGHAVGTALDPAAILISLGAGLLCRKLWHVPLAAIAAAVAYTAYLFFNNSDYWRRIGYEPDFFGIAAPTVLASLFFGLIAFGARRFLMAKHPGIQN